MIALLCFVLAVLAAPCNSKSRLEAENAALRHQLIVLPGWGQAHERRRQRHGNSWVLEMARTRGAKKTTLIALWDCKAMGDAPGGPAQMVQMARKAGTVDIVLIDAGQLLS